MPAMPTVTYYVIVEINAFKYLKPHDVSPTNHVA